MNENNRQIIIFGNFNNLNAAEVFTKLANIRKRHNYQQAVAQNPNGITITTNGPSYFATFYSPDGKESAAFSTTQIVFQEDNCDINTYTNFIKRGFDFIEEAIKLLQLNVSRIACNGALCDSNAEHARNIYEKAFNHDGVFYKPKSDEWDFSVNDKTKENNIDCEINQIIRVIRGDDGILGPNGIINAPLIIVYDYNTSQNNTRPLTEKEIKAFPNLAISFRDKVKNI